MICVECRQRHHDDCPGGTWCDCQHYPARQAAGDGAAGDGAAATAEPAMSWVRQG